MRTRRKTPADSWDRLNGTRLEMLELAGGGMVLRVCVNARDPIPAVVSFGVHALTRHYDGRPTLRTLALDNWNADPRELFQIPEAVKWCRRMWAEGKPLLKLLTESTSDTPADDRLGLSQRDVSGMGFGWFEVFLRGQGRVVDAQLKDTPDGLVWSLFETAGVSRDAVRAELLEMTPATPEGYTFDGAGERRRFLELNHPGVEAAGNALVAAGHADHAVLVLSLEESAGMQIGMAAATGGGVVDFTARVQELRAGGGPPGVVCVMPRTATAVALDALAPGAAKRMAGGPPDGGGSWVVCVAFGGVMLSVWNGAK
jgi:hypothetical protein